jgi:hypothetical protein
MASMTQASMTSPTYQLPPVLNPYRFPTYINPQSLFFSSSFPSPQSIVSIYTHYPFAFPRPLVHLSLLIIQSALLSDEPSLVEGPCWRVVPATRTTCRVRCGTSRLDGLVLRILLRSLGCLARAWTTWILSGFVSGLGQAVMVIQSNKRRTQRR